MDEKIKTLKTAKYNRNYKFINTISNHLNAKIKQYRCSDD